MAGLRPEPVAASYKPPPAPTPALHLANSPLRRRDWNLPHVRAMRHGTPAAACDHLDARSGTRTRRRFRTSLRRPGPLSHACAGPPRRRPGNRTAVVGCGTRTHRRLRHLDARSGTRTGRRFRTSFRGLTLSTRCASRTRRRTRTHAISGPELAHARRANAGCPARSRTRGGLRASWPRPWHPLYASAAALQPYWQARRLCIRRRRPAPAPEPVAAFVQSRAALTPLSAPHAPHACRHGARALRNANPAACDRWMPAYGSGCRQRLRKFHEPPSALNHGTDRRSSADAGAANSQRTWNPSPSLDDLLEPPAMCQQWMPAPAADPVFSYLQASVAPAITCACGLERACLRPVSRRHACAVDPRSNTDRCHAPNRSWPPS